MRSSSVLLSLSLLVVGVAVLVRKANASEAKEQIVSDAALADSDNTTQQSEDNTNTETDEQAEQDQEYQAPAEEEPVLRLEPSYFDENGRLTPEIQTMIETTFPNIWKKFFSGAYWNSQHVRIFTSVGNALKDSTYEV